VAAIDWVRLALSIGLRRRYLRIFSLQDKNEAEHYRA